MLAKKKAKDLVLDALFFIAGSFLFAVSIDTFTAPNQIAAGGLTGVATVSYTHLDVYKRQAYSAAKTVPAGPACGTAAQRRPATLP